jgi:ribosomal protein L35
VAKIKRTLGIKATKAAARHSAHGMSAKAQRKPLRSVSLLSAGVVIGLCAGWAAGRASAAPS